jgi:FkbM family methyltransferase
MNIEKYLNIGPFKFKRNFFGKALMRFLSWLHLKQVVKIQRNGYKIIFFDSLMADYCYKYPNEYRIEEEKFIDLYLKEGDTFIDIGANIGLFSLKAATVVKEAGIVYAIEALPKTFRYLSGNIHYNKFNNVKAYNYAIGEKAGLVNFSDEITDDSQNRILSESGVEVKMITLDELLSDVDGNINLIKVDVEGYEYYSLLGAKSLLKRTECIFFESDEVHFNRYGYCFKDVYKLLGNLSFSVCKLENNSLIVLDQNYKSLECEDLIACKDVNQFSEKMRVVK